MTKYLWIALVALSAALGGTGWLLKQQIAANGKQAAKIEQQAGELTSLAEQDKRNRALIERRARENAAERARADQLAAALDRSLFKNREWAEQPIPQEVQDALE